MIKYGLYFPAVTQEQQSFTLSLWMDRHGGASGHIFAVYDGLIRLLSGMYNVFETLVDRIDSGRISMSAAKM